MDKRSITYRDAGVDITKGNLFVRQISSFVKSTKTKHTLTNIGSFSGLFSIAGERYKEPVLVSSTDGVGTKLMIAQDLALHDTVGYDLVGMSANDVATTGAQPLFFLDYIATGRLQSDVLKDVVKGIAAACKESGYALVGGETAEMPDMYENNRYDLAGFCVGIIDKKDIIDGHSIKKGDMILGLASSGLHSNGYSLVRKIFSKKEIAALQKEMLTPTRLYTKPLLGLQKKVNVKGIAHITGGAYIDKIPRIIPEGLCAEIKKASWPIPKIFKLIQEKGNVEEMEMYRVFNMGIGMVVVIPPKDINAARSIMARSGINSWVIGTIINGNKKVRLI